MLGRKKQQVSDEEMDAIGTRLIRSAAMADDEADQSVSGAFAFQRVRARIEAERARTSALEIKWLASLAAARQAIPAMALIAAAAVGLFWFSENSRPLDGGKTIARVSEYGVDPETPVSACSISSKAECVVSIEEVLAMMMDRSGRETRK